MGAAEPGILPEPDPPDDLRHGHRPPTGTSTQLAIHTRPVTCDFTMHTAQWVTCLAEAHQAGCLSGELTRLGRIPLIVVDEVGYIPFEPETANLFFQFLSGRYERASAIVTSNKPFGKARMFRRTCARQRRNFTGSGGASDTA
ncbi:ATP-binding protein [Streptomyces bobili]|uniref:ATP-binding protein n=1 Tax=Streptomyces bobili TaxID=67280 RepID=UPI0036FB721C